MGLYEVPWSMSLLGFGMGTMLVNFHMCGIMLLRAVFNMLVRNASPRGPMCFRCLMFNLSVTCKFSLFYCLLDLICSECDVMSFFCVALLMYLFVLCAACLTVFVNWLVAILLLNVMDVFSVGGGALLDIPCMVFHRMCVLRLWSICFVCVFVCRKLSPHLRV